MSGFSIEEVRSCARGKLYSINARGKKVSVLFLHHALERMKKWSLSEEQVLETLLFSEEVATGTAKGTSPTGGTKALTLSGPFMNTTAAHRCSSPCTSPMPSGTSREVRPLKIKYSREADVLLIELREGHPVDAIDLKEGVILHLDERGLPLEIEILDASKLASLGEIHIMAPLEAVR